MGLISAWRAVLGFMVLDLAIETEQPAEHRFWKCLCGCRMNINIHELLLIYAGKY